jgi:flavin reductase (DIM6/NTAB) family NADH-FMN oxidoreductase RutF
MCDGLAMFYETAGNAHGLPHDPFKALVAPRPIGWISTRARDGRVNLAPYSFFNALSEHPMLVMFASGGRKDSITFAEESGEFAVNMVSEALAAQMNATAVNAPRGESEFVYAGLTEAPCRLIAAPRVKEAYATLECKVTLVFEPKGLDGNPSEAVVAIGQVVGIHIDETVLTNGMVDVRKARPVSRLGYLDFAVVTETFAMRRPRWGEGGKK